LKKITIVIMALAAGACILLTPAPSHAVEVGFGVNGMYDMWLPAFKRLHFGEPCKLAGYNLKNNDDASLMLGPELGIYTEEWKVNIAVLFGVTKNYLYYSSVAWDVTMWDLSFYSTHSPYVIYGEESARRYDADVKVAKRLNDYFNLNFGARFNYGGGEGSQYRTYITTPFMPYNFGKDKYHLWQVGPEIGIGFNYTIKGFTVYLDINGLINGGNNYLERKLILPMFLPAIVPSEYDGDFLGFGFDTDVGVSYYIEKAHMSLGIGFRWVGVVCVSLGNDGSVLDLSHREGWMTGYWDHFYGLTFNVGFRF
jgi:hypothetical protein